MSTQDPYQPPESELQSRPGQDEEQEREIILRQPRAVPVARAFGWLSEAFALFRQYPVAWVISAVTVISLAIVSRYIPVVGGAVYALFTPVVMGGLMLGCAAQEFGDEFSANYLIAAFTRPFKLIAIAVINLALGLVFILITIGPEWFEVVSKQLSANELAEQFVAWGPRSLAAVALMVPLNMAMWFAPALIALHDVDVITAARLSFLACLKNLLTIIVYCIALGVLFFLGMLPFLLGLLVVYPVMFISLYTSYRDIFTHEEVGIT